MTSTDSPATPLQLASRKAGSDTALAKLIGKHQTTVSERVRLGREVWPEDVLTIERELGISRHDLRPDLYPREESPAHPPATEPLPAGGSSASLESAQA